MGIIFSIWIGTIIASFGLEIANELRMFKDVADAGYKIDTKRLAEFQKEFNPDGAKVTLLSMLVLVVNVLLVFQRAQAYNNVRSMMLDQLSAIDALEKMSEFEKAEYEKKPTGLNALIIPMKTEIKLAQATKLKINEEYGESEIYYEFDNATKNIIILKVTGPASRLTEAEQKQKIIDTWKSVFQEVKEKYGDESELYTLLANNKVVDLSDNKEEKDEEMPSSTSQDTFTENNKQTLENLTSELSEEQEVGESIQPDKGRTLSIRRK